ncbi:hypothetical protein ACRE_016150 [Hapsidospora chrysogenum ATCC 11550]|uniref:Uncharacterized protein n=1 Tax=Hapsidospora chrysogenum (strain ATCC 11550 / CBS 779.69 / DSM 880 / IAM 14645 / JCM 23072 / IMI 49137) TaxID=857340 RepID=A0A086TDW0_HAPC1|nr:hypothetical protein ACRE_016150 [Hapsidospora chrysogenum ATCC 11550]
MTFTVLSDDQIRDTLENLSHDELDEFRNVLATALHEFSTNPKESYQQPLRISTHHPTSRAMSLYMPSCGPEGMGCKIVSLTTSDVTDADPSVKPIPPTGVVNLFTPTGQPLGLLNASTLTAFRTALASTCLLSRRAHVRTITVFGAGSQAYWHVRLALMLRGSTIRKVHVVNRRFSDAAGAILRSFSLVDPEIKKREGWEGAEFSMLTPAFHDYERLLTENLLASDVIYCCTPSREPVFDGSILTSHDGRRRGRLVVAVGSFKPDMHELPEELLLQATKPHHGKGHRHFHRHADEGGVVVVDTLEGALTESGEIISAKIGANQLVELGELVMLDRLPAEESEDNPLSQTSTDTLLDSEKPSEPSAAESSSTATSPTTNSGSRFPSLFHKRSSSSASDSDKKTKKETEDGRSRWLRDGTVVYKSVGLGLMDLVVGNHIVKVARAKNIGTQIPGF